jgi:3-phenylpropionate/trans-cinnamate dioxygenase ferredoxin reductase subunit
LLCVWTASDYRLQTAKGNGEADVKSGGGRGRSGSSLLRSAVAQQGFEGDITLIGEEPVLPYQRPPLSKAYLLGDMALDRLFLRPASFYEDQNITLRTGVRVSAIDPKAKTVTVGDDDLHYDHLVLATGSVPRRLPAAIGGDLEGVLEVRTLADADAMAPRFPEGKRVLIVGGGYIGLEAAAVAAKLGLRVTLVEAAERILQRVAAPETSDFFRELHTNHGVDIREGVGLERLTGEGHVSGAILSDGTSLEIDFAVVGVGITPATELAEAAGLIIDNGIATNALGQTSDPAIWAAGDCASFPGPGGQMRLESVGGAIDMGELVADNILGAEREYQVKPWFWSDQYDCKLQIAGLNTGYDRLVVRKGDCTLSHWYYAGDRLLALDAMNDPRAYMVGKRLIEAGKSPDPDAVADPATDLKALLKA